VIREFHASENEYFHPDFHSSMNMGIEYLGRYHGQEDVKAYLARFARNGYKSVIQGMRKDPLKALADQIRRTYIAEKAEDALHLEVLGDQLRVRIAYCPAVKHLRATGREVSQWFCLTTATVMETLAKAGNLAFTMEYYDAEIGAAGYVFKEM
jgi:hypothetical protein